MLNTQEGSMKMGQLLVARGWATGEQIIRAVTSQRNLGGRLGTRLLELEIVSEDHLLEILAEQQAAPAVPLEQLHSIPSDILGLISSDLAQRCSAIPFAATEREIHVATPSLRNLALLDELAFNTGRRVKAFVTHEVRIYEALEKYYSIPCPLRYRQLAQRLASSRGPMAAPPQPGNGSRIQPGNGSRLPSGNDSQIRWNSAEEIFDLNPETSAPEASAPEDSATEDSAPEASTPEANASTDLTLADVDHLLGYADNVSAMGEIILRFISQNAERGALFRLRQETLEPWLGQGEGFNRALFRQLEIRFSEPSVFLNLSRGAEFHYGPLPPMPTHRELVRCWEGPWPAKCLLLPIRLRDRMVMVLYADPGSERPEGIRIEDWKTLAAMVTDALELSILRKKLPGH